MNIFYRLQTDTQTDDTGDEHRGVLFKRNIFNSNVPDVEGSPIVGCRNDDCSGYDDDDNRSNTCDDDGDDTDDAVNCPVQRTDGVIIMQTASSDFPGPTFYLNGCVYPTQRTTFRYTCANCEHVFKTQMIQIRSGDEGESLVQTCEKCGMKKINN